MYTKQTRSFTRIHLPSALFVFALLTTILAFVVKRYVSRKVSPILGTVLAIPIGLYSLIVWLVFIYTSGTWFLSWFITTKVGRICMLIAFVGAGGFKYFGNIMKSDSPKQVFYDKEGPMHYDKFSKNEANDRIDAKKREE